MALAQQVPPGAKFADVGTDHARLPVWLLQQGTIGSAIATDLREGPLDRARQTAQRHGMTEHVSFRLGDGLSPLRPGEADVVAIAGMGGETIGDILAAAPWVRTNDITLLLQAMTSTADLRRRLDELGFHIRRETLVREERTIYVVLTAAFGPHVSLTAAEQWAGRQFKGMVSPLRGAYLAIMSQRAGAALEGLRRSTRPEDAKRRAELEELCAQMGAMEQEWNAWQS